MAQTKHVGIIGGGYTGLVAAYELAKAGYKVSLYERSPAVGGLASGFTIEGAPLERAYHHLFKTDRDIIELTEELGIADKLQWHDSSISIYWNERLYPFVTPLDLLRFKPLRFFNRIRAGLVVLYLQKTNNWQKFQDVSAYRWMLRWSGKQVTKVIWEPLLRGKFDHYYDKVSMAWLWARIHIRANSKQKGDSGEKLGYFEGGFDVFTQALLEKLAALKVEIVTNVIINKVDSTKRPSMVIDGKKQSFDKIIATVPSEVFARLTDSSTHMTAAYRKKLSAIDYLGAVLMIFSSRQELSKYYWHNINDIQLPFLVFINHTRLIDKSRYNNKNIYYVGAYVPHDHKLFAMPENEIRDYWYENVKKVFPSFVRKQIDESYVFKFKNAQHIVTAGCRERIPAYKTPLNGVYLANFSQIYPEDRGTNYAVREGKKIAALVQKSK